MIIATDPRFILFSVNKTGTSSMDQALAPYFDEQHVRTAFLDASRFPARLARKDARSRQRLARRQDWNGVPTLKHARLEWLDRRWRYLYPELRLEDMYKACFVRNPFDRLLSIYSYHTQSLHKRFPAAREAGSFKAWLEMGGTGSATTPMKAWTHDRKGRQVVDFIGRYETLHEDWAALLSQLGLPALELPHHPRTRSSHESYTDVYTPELREIVLANPVWHEDARVFGYL